MTAPMFDGTQPCAGADPELFFPPEQAEAKERIRRAKEICADCRFRAPCLEAALWWKAGAYYVAGVWGGTSETERKRIRAAQRRPEAA